MNRQVCELEDLMAAKCEQLLEKKIIGDEVTHLVERIQKEADQCQHQSLAVC